MSLLNIEFTMYFSSILVFGLDNVTLVETGVWPSKFQMVRSPSSEMLFPSFFLQIKTLFPEFFVFAILGLGCLKFLSQNTAEVMFRSMVLASLSASIRWGEGGECVFRLFHTQLKTV